MTPLRIVSAVFAGMAILALSVAPTAADDNPSDDTFTPNEIVKAGSDFFGISCNACSKTWDNPMRISKATKDPAP